MNDDFILNEIEICSKLYEIDFLNLISYTDEYILKTVKESLSNRNITLENALSDLLKENINDIKFFFHDSDEIKKVYSFLQKNEENRIKTRK